MTTSVSAQYSAINALDRRTPVYRATFTRNNSPVELRRFSTHPICDWLTESLADSPSMLIPFDDASGTTASGEVNSINGAYRNTPTLGAAGPLVGSSRTAVTLNGTDEDILVADNPLLDPGDVFTLSIWIKPANITGGVNRYLFHKGTNGYGFIQNGATFLLVKSGAGSTIASTGSVLVASVWQHLAVTKNGATTKLYLNGVDVTVAGVDSTIVATANDLIIGSADGSSPNFFNGSLFGASLYPTALSAARIAALHGSGLALHHLSTWTDLMQLPRGISEQVEPHKGRRNVSSMSAVFTDRDEAITELIGDDGVGGDLVTIEGGFANLQGEEFATILTGKVTGCKLTADLTGYDITIEDPQTLTNRKLFSVAAARLTLAAGSGDSEIWADNVDDFLDAGYLHIDDEFVQYTGKDNDINIPAEQWQDICYGNGIFVAVATDGSVVTSPDGRAWTSRTPAAANQWTGVAWSELLGLFAVVGRSGTDRVMTSPDGITWTSRDDNGSTDLMCVAVVPSTGAFVALDAVGGGASSVLISTNGTSWSRSASTPNDATWTAIAFDENDRGVCVAADGTISTIDGSSSGTMVERTVPAGPNVFNTVAYSESLGRFVVISGSSGGDQVVTSDDDGVTWTRRTSANEVAWRDVVWSAGHELFVAVASTGSQSQMVMTSPTGITWTARTARTSNEWKAIAVGPRFCAVVMDVSGVAQTSEDGFDWSLSSSQFTGCTRGKDLAGVTTAAASHAVGAGVQEVLRLGPGHPIDILEDVDTNTDKTGLGIDPSLLDLTQYATVKAAIGAPIQMDFLITKEANGKAWRESEIFAPLALYPRTTGNGLLSIVEVAAPGSADGTIDHDSICFDGGRPMLEWDHNFDSVINTVIFQFDWDPIAGAFRSTKTFTDSASILKYGPRPITFPSLGFRAHLAGTIGLMQRIADAIFERYANTAPLVTATVFLSKHLFEAGDIAGVTTALLPDRSPSQRGLTAELMEIFARENLYEQGQVRLRMLDTSWSS